MALHLLYPPLCNVILFSFPCQPFLLWKMISEEAFYDKAPVIPDKCQIFCKTLGTSKHEYAFPMTQCLGSHHWTSMNFLHSQPKVMQKNLDFSQCSLIPINGIKHLNLSSTTWHWPIFYSGKCCTHSCEAFGRTKASHPHSDGKPFLSITESSEQPGILNFHSTEKTPTIEQHRH